MLLMLQSLVFPTTNSWEEDVFQLTPLGVALVAALIIILIALAVWLFSRKKAASSQDMASGQNTSSPKNSTKKTAVKQLTFSAMAMALAMLLSNVKILDLFAGGSATLCSMFFITLIGYFYGTGAGLLTGLAYGLLQFVINPVFYTLPQLLIDYPLAFGALGLSGLFRNKKWGLQIGYVTGIVGRFFFSWLSGILFFASYAESYQMLPALYSFCYNGSYIAAEGVITLIIISLPPVRKGLDAIRRMTAV